MCINKKKIISKLQSRLYFCAMKKMYLLSLLLIMSYFSSFSQQYRNGVGINIGGLDFYGLQAGKYGLHMQRNRLNGKQERVINWEPALQVAYWHAFNKHLDLKLSGLAANVHYPVTNKDSIMIKAKEGLRSLRFATPYYAFDAKAVYSIIARERYRVSPYVTLGASANFRKDETGFSVPAGIGFNVRVAEGLYVNLESNFHTAITSNNQNHLSHFIGFNYWWKGYKAIPVKVNTAMSMPAPEPPKIPDTDNDGVNDNDDKCPYHPGPKTKGGCPDKDNDGVYDFEDKCPNQAGPALYGGCPDTDKDGIIDMDDKCPNEAGTLANQGCPEIKQEVIEKVNIAAKGVNFETGKAVLTEASYKQLDVIIETLKNDPSLNVDIEGHTDNKGKSENNLILSQQRADVCKDYLIKSGIDAARISSVGYGDMKPIADNTTEEGRAQNRRTEFLLKR